MSIEKFSHVMNEIDGKYLDEAIHYQKKRRWIKWASIAACFTVVVVLSVSLLQGRGIGNTIDVATLDNGDQIIFVKSDTVGGSLSLNIDAKLRKLTEEETHTLFGDLSVTANAIYIDDNIQQLIGFEGKIGGINLTISTSTIQLVDTVIDGNEESTEICGISVEGGYLVTDSNSKGERNVIYYATFKLGENTIYVENAGAERDSETVKNELAAVIQNLINNGEFDLTSFETSGVTDF